MAAINSNLDQISAACREHRVRRLELFGSRARNDARDDSDFDFLVEFEPPLLPGIFHRYMSLLLNLQSISGANVDLIERSTVASPRFRDSIEQDRTLVYAA